MAEGGTDDAGLAGSALAGVVKSFGAQKGFGFITSDEVDGDIYFNNADLGPELAGLEPGFYDLSGRAVTFTLSLAKDGKPQAKDVQVTAEDGEPIVGQVKSFNQQKGFGFVTSSMRPERDIYFQARDVSQAFQHADLVGRRVRFHVGVTPDGKPQARDMAFSAVFSGGSTSSSAWAQGVAVGVGAALGGLGVPSASRRVRGEPGAARPAAPGAYVPALPARQPSATSVATPKQPSAGRPASGWPPAAPSYAPASAPPARQPWVAPPGGSGPASALRGDPLGVYGRAGGAAAPRTSVRSSPYGAAVPYGAAMAYAAAAFRGGGLGKGFPMYPEIAPQSGAHLSGEIKSFDPAKGYGFIHAVPGVSKDVYFKVVDGEVLSKGEQVNFVLNWSKDGKPQAANISRALSEGEQTRGTIKSFNAKNGYGFVSVEGSSRDVYFKGSALPQGLEAAAADGSLVGTAVRFVVKLAADGKPQLRDLVLEGETVSYAPAAPQQGAKRKAWTPAEPAAAKRPRVATAPTPAGGDQEEAPDEALVQLHGVVKSFNPAKGYGFISSDEVEGDVWFRKATLPQEHQGSQELAGQEVIFGLTRAQDGKPQAATIEVIGQAFE